MIGAIIPGFRGEFFDPQPALPKLRIMPANASGWFWHGLARETGRLGHLYSPRAQRGPWPWFPYALDNGAFAAWTPSTNVWDPAKWSEQAWRELLLWAQCAPLKALWAIVPDVPGHTPETLERWVQFAPSVQRVGIPLALAVQDGMTPEMVRGLRPHPEVICVGGSTDWKWATVADWARSFPRVHLLRCNAPDKLEMLAQLGVESCDGTGWSRGDRTQTSGLEAFCRRYAVPTTSSLWPYVCREPRNRKQVSFV